MEDEHDNFLKRLRQGGVKDLHLVKLSKSLNALLPSMCHLDNKNSWKLGTVQY